MRTDPFGDRFRRYEKVTRQVLLPGAFHIVRVDGRGFSRYLQHVEKPFDSEFTTDMGHVGTWLCSEIGAYVAYGQSDEISVLLNDTAPQSQLWFGGVVQKIVSVAAGIATAELITQRGAFGHPHFDARVLTLPSATEVMNYFIWRQRDAVRNSISMAAQSKFTQDQLHGKGSGQMQEMLFSEHGINWHNYPDVHKRGWLAAKTERPATVTFTDKRSGEEQTIEALRTHWQVDAAPRFYPDDAFFQLLGLGNNG